MERRDLFGAVHATAEVRWAVPSSWGTIVDAHLLGTAGGELVIAFELEGGGTRLALFTDLLTVPTYAGTLGMELTVRRSPLPIAAGVLLAGDGGSGPVMTPVNYAEITMDDHDPLEEL